MGSLRAATDSRLLALEQDVLMQILLDNDHATFLGIRYAQLFVNQLNECCDTGGVDDLFSFRTEDDMNLVSDELEHSDDHLIFVSHYKLEAGTEAAMIADVLNRMIGEDPTSHANKFSSPIFLDSEDLFDLSSLTDHVKRSENVVLLLTPNLFQRPWCLVEIVTALRSEIPVVPVEVQRPGISFQYPTEEFYRNLKSGNYLEASAVKLLEDLQIYMEDVEEAIRNVFRFISIPFSPHKAAAMRQMELEAVLQRCGGRAETIGTRGSAAS